MRVIFGVPSLSGMWQSRFGMSLIVAMRVLWEKGIDCDVIDVSNCPCISVARDSIVSMFLENEQNTDLFFIDSDEQFDPLAVLKILERPEEIVAGIYPLKQDELAFPVRIKTKGGIPIGRDGLVEAELLPTGFMRIKREVFSKLAEAYPDLRYEESVVRVDGKSLSGAFNFFGMGVYGRKFSTEDFAFCQRWADIGGQMWILPDIDFGHIGSKAYTGNYHRYLCALPGGIDSNIGKAVQVAGWMSIPELSWLAAQARMHKRIVEIGSWAGRSTRALADNTSGKVTAVDTWLGSEEHKEALAEVHPDGLYRVFLLNTADLKNLTPVRASSVDGAKSLAGRKFDLIFIDASHDYDNVKADLEAWLPLLEEDGVMCGHDASYPGVTKALQELLPSYQVAPGTDIWFWRR